MYEQYSADCSILLGKIDIFASQFGYYLGSKRWLPLDPVSRTQAIPADSLARFLLVLRSSLCIEFSYLDAPTSTQIADSSLDLPSNEPPATLDSSVLPPLPPRPTPTQLDQNIVKDTIQAESYVDVRVEGTCEPSLPRSTTPLVVAKSDAVPLIPLNNGPPPPLPYRAHHPHVRPPQNTSASSPSILGKLSKLFMGSSSSSSAQSTSSSSTHRDAWFHDIYNSKHNHLPQMAALYNAFRAHGYANVASELPYLPKFVYLYVPGLYSGRNPFGNRANANSTGGSAEGKLTKHQSRVNELKAVGLDTRMIIVPNDGTVYSNARLISDAVQQTFAETGKHIVLIGYSKGGVDSAAAMSMVPEIVPMIRCFITLFSPLHGSHIATDIEDSVLRPVVYLGIKNLLDADTAAMRDLSMSARANFIFAYPFNEQVPSLSLASTVASFARTSSFSKPYRYILSNYHKENDGLVACQDAIYPGAEVILVSGMDHTGPRPDHPVYRDHVSFILSVIQTALNTTRSKWSLDDEPEPTLFEDVMLPAHVPISSDFITDEVAQTQTDDLMAEPTELEPHMIPPTTEVTSERSNDPDPAQTLHPPN